MLPARTSLCHSWYATILEATDSMADLRRRHFTFSADPRRITIYMFLPVADIKDA